MMPFLGARIKSQAGREHRKFQKRTDAAEAPVYGLGRLGDKTTSRGGTC